MPRHNPNIKVITKADENKIADYHSYIVNQDILWPDLVSIMENKYMSVREMVKALITKKLNCTILEVRNANLSSDYVKYSESKPIKKIDNMVRALVNKHHEKFIRNKNIVSYDSVKYLHIKYQKTNMVISNNNNVSSTLSPTFSTIKKFINSADFQNVLTYVVVNSLKKKAMTQEQLINFILENNLIHPYMKDVDGNVLARLFQKHPDLVKEAMKLTVSNILSELIVQRKVTCKNGIYVESALAVELTQVQLFNRKVSESVFRKYESTK